jgi:tetratricopeptide (TPR) repeat protein
MDESLLHTALTHHKAGRLAEAQLLYKQLLSVDPRQPTVLNYHGVLAIQTGQIELAIKLLERAVAANPLDASYRCNLGEAQRQASRVGAAIASFKKAIELKPDLAVAHNNLGIVLAADRYFEQAISSYQSAIALQPAYAEAHGNLGNALRECERLEEAISHCRTAVILKPELAQCHSQLGAALAENGEIEEAIEAYRIAIHLDPNLADAHMNLGNALAAQGRVQDAVTSCQTAVHLHPYSISAHWNFAVALLRAGDYQRGWVEHEWRLRSASPDAAPRFSKAAWNGNALAGKTIFLHAEQGFGDTLQFIRYVPLVAAGRQGESDAHMGAGRVIVECAAELVRLVRESPGVDGAIARGDPLPHFDEHAPLMSLPLIFQSRLHNLPATVPYLQADAVRIGQWKARVTAFAGPEHIFHVGLCWAGNAVHRNDRQRSIPFHQLAPLASDGILFHSLQKEPVPPQREGLRIVDHSKSLFDFADTAALLANLDMVITVDTAVAHLSGAMGIACCVLLAALPDWRWMLHRQDSAWYPTLRLYRQQRPGQWSDVLRRVAGLLRTIVRKTH